MIVISPADLVQEVSVSGKVVAAQSVDLVFSQSGRVSAVYAKTGDAVNAGRVLASLENGDARAEVLQKSAAYDAALAKLKSLKEGTRPEQIAVTESKVASAKATLDQADQTFRDAIRNAYIQSDDAIRNRVYQLIINPESSQPKFSYITLNPQLNSDIETGWLLAKPMLIEWKASLDTLSHGSDFTTFFNTVDKNLWFTQMLLDDTAIAVNSLSASPTLPQATIDDYRSRITSARNNVQGAMTTLTSAVTSRKNAHNTLITAEKNLELEKSGSSSKEIEEQEAKVKATEADLSGARARLQKTLVTAPFTGVVTRMDAKVGGSASSNSSIISMLGADTLQVESFVPELNAPLISAGDEAVSTLDAYGETASFPLSVISIDPAETIRDGVVTYRVKLKFKKKDSRIKSGMTANVVIITEKKTSVIGVPQGIIIKRGGKKFVRVEKDKLREEKEVETGIISSLGMIEIISGLSQGEKVILNAGD